MPDPNTNSPELHGLDPGELLVRGMHTVRFSGTVHDWTPPSPEELAHLLPQYGIESLLGRGGMGAVYKGFQEKLGRAVAIKILPSELTADEQFVNRFEREARTLAKLQYPGIVSIYDFGQTSDGHLYFVMEYVEGTDLRRVLEGPGLEPGQALKIITQICEALHAAHRQGVIHRDIKPANILITTDGRVKLADFGLARPDHEERESLTMSNAVLGTPDYMAPEQREGRSDSRVDIYALGVMLYEMLTGQLPRGAWAPPSRKVQVDVRIDEVVLKALQHEPDLRYQQASEMKTDVDSIRSGPAAEAAVSATKKQPRTVRQRPAILVPWIIGIGILAIGIAVLFPTPGGDKTRTEPAVAVSSTSKQDAEKPAATGPANPETGNSEPGPSLAGAIEDPMPNCPLIRRFRFPDTDSGLRKDAYIPAKPGYGLIVRFSCAVDFLEEADLEMGYDEKTVWEWVQVPPLNGRGENTVIVTYGTPTWMPSDVIMERITSGMAVRDDIFWGEKIPLQSVEVNPLPDRFVVTLTRSTANDPNAEETFLHYEIIPVPHAELKKMYPQLRGPGETAGEDCDWIYPAPDGAKWKAAAEKALAAQPDRYSKRMNYGWSLLNLDRYSEAAEVFQKAAALWPGDTEITAALAVTSFMSGDEKGALRLYAEVVKQDSDYANWGDIQDYTSGWGPKARRGLHELLNKWKATPPPAEPGGK